MEKVNFETATQEVEKWLNYKKVKPSRRESLRSFIDILVEAVQLGQLTLGENHEWIMALDFPIGEIKELTFKPRITDAELSNYKRNVKGVDAFDTQQLVLLCGLTTQMAGTIRNLDTADRAVADAIVLFFQ